MNMSTTEPDPKDQRNPFRKERTRPGQIERQRFNNLEVFVSPRQVTSLLADVRARLEAERAAGPPDREELQTKLTLAQAEADKAQVALDQTKELAKQRKREIDEWKSWYDQQPEEEKESALAKLLNEVTWRAAELEGLGPKITQAAQALINATAPVEAAKQQLAAFDAGVHLRPLEEDPRLQTLTEVQAEVQITLEPETNEPTTL